MHSALTRCIRKPVQQPTRRRLTALLMTAAFVLVPATATPQLSAGGPEAHKRALSPDANGATRPGEAIELTMLLRERGRRPLIDAAVPPVVRYRLSAAYEIALGELRNRPACGSLFRQLGADGEAVLARSQYYDAGETGYCGERVRAFTRVGSTQIRLCRSFGDLQPWSAALLLIHEALHASGLRESPAYPNAMTADEINAAVSQACNLW
jgi:hypothetical protein